jgi:hypothetical protein
MGAIKVKVWSTQGTRSRLTRAQPRTKAADPRGFTSRPRAPSSDGHNFGSPEAQSSRRSNLGQIATPTDRIAGQSRSDRSHIAAPLTDLTGKQRRLPRSDCCATRQSEADSS